MTGRVNLPRTMPRPGLPDWAVWGDADHRHNLINSIYLSEPELEKRNHMIQRKYDDIRRDEQRANTYRTEDARVLVLACNTPARMAKGAVEELRHRGHPVGLFHPVTLWPFPVDALRSAMEQVTDLVIVEASAGQLEDETRLALSKAGVAAPRIHSLRRMGGILPQEDEILSRVESVLEVTS